MGRGRAKAKQVKVARQLKYNSGGMDLDRLQAELGSSTDQHDEDDADSYADDDSDSYADYGGDRYADEEEDEGEDASV
jgi:hypothetical protein